MHNLDIANKGNTPTFVGRGQTVIDVTFGTVSLISEIVDWRVAEEESLSDHRFIKFGLRGKGENPAYFRNPRKTNWEDYRKRLEEELLDFSRRYGTPEEVEEAVVHIERAITRSYEHSCDPTIRSSKKLDLW